MGMMLIPVLALIVSYIIIRKKYHIDEKEYERLIHYWYADGEEKERKLDVDYMKRNRIIKTYPVLFLPVFSFYFWDDQ